MVKEGKRRISRCCRFLTFTCLPPRTRCTAIALGSLWTPIDHLTKLIFHIQVTFDFWWLYINVDLWYYLISILIKINWCFINHLLSWYVILSIRHLYATLYKWIGKMCVRKSAGKNTEMNKTSNFLLKYIILLILTQNNYQLKFLVHQNGENAKSKWLLIRWNDVTWKLMFHLYFPNQTLYFSFTFANINILE